jgi:competence protein ComEA
MRALVFALLVLFASQAMAAVDLNSAPTSELEALPGIGAKKAQAIVAFREKRPFRRVTELMRVKGIGPKLFHKLKDHVRVGS